ncbi:hypothetical protein [uncultured Sphingomonas sp.]|uniref:hypothetical protein n=1 Tax=uncultured Sphingomonas sp. TaxID=158754 RepID=UPI00261747BB|nr:hypothetical protein [uncultured Sphingomonas sp.]
MGKGSCAASFSLPKFDPAHHLHIVTIDRRMLESGPGWANNAPVFDRLYADRVAGYHGAAHEDFTLGEGV